MFGLISYLVVREWYTNELFGGIGCEIKECCKQNRTLAALFFIIRDDTGYGNKYSNKKDKKVLHIR